MDFCGNIYHRLDAKGRASVPSKYRKILDEKYGCLKLMISIVDGGLVVYPLSEWENFKQTQLSNLDLNTPEGRQKKRQLAGNAEEVDVDAQGRISLSPSLQGHAGLSKGEELVFVGVIEVFEIWHPERWQAQNS